MFVRLGDNSCAWFALLGRMGNRVAGYPRPATELPGERERPNTSESGQDGCVDVGIDLCKSLSCGQSLNVRPKDVTYYVLAHLC